MPCIAGVVFADGVYFSLSQHLIYNFIFTQSSPNKKPRLWAGLICQQRRRVFFYFYNHLTYNGLFAS